MNGLGGPFYGLSEHLDELERAPEPLGTTLICPFDSLLWQRQRAEDLLGFHYRVELYVPPPKRTYGYYVLPILHNGQLVGRVDPKMHRSRGVFEIKRVHLEPGFQPDGAFSAGLRGVLSSLASFLGATDIHVPRDWYHLT